MEIATTDASDARIRTLENKIRDTEPMVKGLIEETLDLKAVFVKLSREADESSRAERGWETNVRGTAGSAQANLFPFPSGDDLSGGSTEIQPAGAHLQDNPSCAEPAMALIMQADGTMKMEARSGDRNQTDSSGGYGPTRMAHLSRSNRSPLNR
jgi:hypothetical protein